MGVPVVPTVDLHALLSFAVRCQSTNFVKKGGVFWIDYLCSIFVEYNLHPLGLGLPCVGWYRLYLEK